MLNIGLIGLGPDWETLYAPALGRLSRRLKVTAVYDSVHSRAVQAADQLRAWPLTGIRSMLTRSDIKAVLVLESGWHGLAPIELAVDHELPAFLASPFEADVQHLERVSRAAGSAGVLMMPCLPLRSAPASARLRELTATQIGPATRFDIHVVGHIDFNTSLLAGIIDWAAQMAQARPVEIGEVLPTDTPDGVGLTVVLERGGAAPARVSVSIRSSEPQAGGESSTAGGCELIPFRAAVECAQGRAEVLSAGRITWQSSTDRGDENLETERTGLDLTLDYFARRVVGGLIPVPGLEDVCRVLRTLSAAAPESARSQ